MIDRHADLYDDRDAFLQVTLGLISFSKRLHVLLADCTPASATCLTAARCPPDSMLDFLLGLIAFSERMAFHLRDASRDSAAQSPAALDDQTGNTLVTLRRLLV